MGRKHYSGKELIYRRQMEAQRQQGSKNPVRQTLQDIKRMKHCVEDAKKDMRKKEGKSQ